MHAAERNCNSSPRTAAGFGHCECSRIESLSFSTSCAMRCAHIGGVLRLYPILPSALKKTIGLGAGQLCVSDLEKKHIICCCSSIDPRAWWTRLFTISDSDEARADCSFPIAHMSPDIHSLITLQNTPAKPEKTLRRSSCYFRSSNSQTEVVILYRAALAKLITQLTQR